MKITNPSAKIIKSINGVVASLRDGQKKLRIVVGVSGGCDSMTLLHALHRSNKKNGNIDLLAVHVNHNLRHGESRRDEEAVYAFCQQNKIELQVNHVYPKEDKLSGESVEMTCRRLRYNMFQEAAAAFGTNIVFIAHNQNDQVETVLMKACTTGNASVFSGIKAVSQRDGITYVRPLLSISRDEIEGYAAHNHVPFVNDSSNLDQAFKRNFIRAAVVPLLRQINPMAIQHIAEASAEFAEMEEFVRPKIDEIKEKRSWKYIVPSSSPNKQLSAFLISEIGDREPYFITKRAFIAWLSGFDIDIKAVSSQQIDACLEVLTENVVKQFSFKKYDGTLIWFNKILKKDYSNRTYFFEHTDAMFNGDSTSNPAILFDPAFLI